MNSRKRFPMYPHRRSMPWRVLDNSKKEVLRTSTFGEALEIAASFDKVGLNGPYHVYECAVRRCA